MQQNYEHLNLYFKPNEIWVKDSVIEIRDRLKDEGINVSLVEVFKRLLILGIQNTDESNLRARESDPLNFSKEI